MLLNENLFYFFFSEMDKEMLKLIWKCTEPRITKMILENKTKQNNQYQIINTNTISTIVDKMTKETEA